MSWMEYLADVIAERRPSSAFVRGGLAALSYAFRAAVQLRHFAYAQKWLSSAKLSVPVVSVGNIVVGGSGKTPVVQMLTRALQDACKIAILSRGYASSIERSGQTVKVASGGRTMYAPGVCGDEPFCLGQETLADVWVGRDRVECGRRAIQEGAECLILDDGMQHRRLARDAEVVVVDGKDPFAQGRFLPRGRLRDTLCRLKAADLLIGNHVADAAGAARLQQELKPYTDAPLVCVFVRPLEEEKIRKQRVGVFCGIGRPERFIDTLRACDADIVDTLFLLDHHAPKIEQLRQFIDRCQKKGASHILCTVKDAVKLPACFQVALPIFAVKMQLEISCGRAHWDAFLARLITKRVLLN
jgi:tetraacyldisaccharide 4'-kinase